VAKLRPVVVFMSGAGHQTPVPKDVYASNLNISFRTYERDRSLCTGKTEFLTSFRGDQHLLSIPVRRRIADKLQD